MKKDNLLDELFPDSDVTDESVQTLKDEAEARQSASQNGGNRVYNFYLKKDRPKGLISFLNEGKLFPLYSVEPKGSSFSEFVLALPKGDPLGEAGFKSRKLGVFVIIDWLNSFKNKRTGEIVSRPAVKLLIRGTNDLESYNARKNDRKHGRGTLLGRKWEVEKRGSNTSSYYDLDAQDEEHTPDFEETMTYNGKDGPTEIPLIQAPDWPEYDTDLPTNKQSVYTLKQMKPEEPLNLNDADSVNKWLICHLLNTPMGRYEELAATATIPFTGGKRPDGAPSSGVDSGLTDNDWE